MKDAYNTIDSPPREKGVWEEVLRNGHIMLVDTNFNIIRVKNARGHIVRYEIEDGITITDIECIRNSHSRLRV